MRDSLLSHCLAFVPLPHSGLLVVFTLLHLAATTYSTTNVYNIHWNTTNPMFQTRDTNVIDINGGNHPWEYDQVNIVCPYYEEGVGSGGDAYPNRPLQHHQQDEEQYIIYSVSQQEYESCRITQSSPKIVALCNNPHKLMYFTITFRSFTPTPGGLEFHPGKDYYFISTSSRNDIHRRVGGGCSTHNMKIKFRVAPSSEAEAAGTEVESNEIAKIEVVARPDVTNRYPWSEQRDFRRAFSASDFYQTQQQLSQRRRPKNSSEYNAIKREATQEHLEASSGFKTWAAPGLALALALASSLLLC